MSRDNIWKGAGLAYGQPVEAVPKLDSADVVLAIDSDLLSSAPGHLRFARDFASRRNPTRTQKMLRLYAVEPTPTLTGSVADHRFIAGPRELHRDHHGAGGRNPAAIAAFRRTGLGRQSGSGSHGKSPAARWCISDPTSRPRCTLSFTRSTRSLARVGTTLDLIAPVVHSPIDQAASLNDLVEDMRAGKVSTLLIIDSNPAYTAPGTLGFAEALRRVDFSMTLAVAPNETSDATVWGVPMAHAWETWSDARAFDGTATILQPQALPLYQGISTHRMLALFTDACPAAHARHRAGYMEEPYGCGFSRRPGTTRWPMASFQTPPVRRPTCRCARMPEARCRLRRPTIR